MVTITLKHTDPGEAQEVINLAFAEIYRVQNLMSVYDENSEIYALNRHGLLSKASPETTEVIRRGIVYARLTRGSFNIAILPVLRLWQERAPLNLAPTDSELVAALELADWEKIGIEGRNIRFEKPGMGVTLAGVAKGFAIDKAIEAIRNNGITKAMVNAGGDIRVIGGNSDGIWKIGIRNPAKRRNLIEVVSLSEQAIATSGTYKRSLNDLLDPYGKQVSEVQSASVITDNATDADALSTSIHVLGIERGIRLIEQSRAAEALIISKSAQVFMSSNFQSIQKR